MVGVVRVTEVDDENAPLALLVDNNEMTLYRLHEILRQQDHRVLECKNGDQAVDLFITEKPAIVFISLDIPGLDGHITALEMRESRNQTRIVFITPHNKLTLARDAAFSAGAVALLEKPVSRTSVVERWEDINGVIPDAPGLADLDELYPDLTSAEEDDSAAVDLPPPPPPSVLPAMAPPPKRGGGRKGLLILAALLFIGAAGAIGYGLMEMGYISL